MVIAFPTIFPPQKKKQRQSNMAQIPDIAQYPSFAPERYNYYLREGGRALRNSDTARAKSQFELAQYHGSLRTFHRIKASFGIGRIALKEMKPWLFVYQLLWCAISFFFTTLIQIAYATGFYLPMHPETRNAFSLEFSTAVKAWREKNYQKAELHVGYAHIIGNSFFTTHIRCHLLGMIMDIERRYWKRSLVQLVRTIGSFGTRIFIHSWGVTGNPGTAAYPIGYYATVPQHLREPIKASLHDAVFLEYPQWDY
jgi:hypothetical protein